MRFTESIREQMDRMKPGDRRALLFLTLFLLLVMGYVFLLEPLILAYQGAQRELDELDKQQRGYLQQIRMLPRRESKWAEHTMALESLKRHFNREVGKQEMAVSKVILELSEYAEQCAVEISTIRPLDAEVIGRYLESPVEVEVEGDYNGLHKFFYSIETSSLLLAITDLDLRPHKDGRLRARVKLSIITAGKESEKETQETHRTEQGVPQIGKQELVDLVLSSHAIAVSDGDSGGVGKENGS